MTTYSPTVFPSFQTSDSEAMIGLLDSLGFAERILVRDDNDPSRVVHAEYRWRETGGLMFGSARGDGSIWDRTGGAMLYLVAVDDAEVHRLHAVIDGMGNDVAKVESAPESKPYGGIDFSFVDFDGNSWCIGSYAGA